MERFIKSHDGATLARLLGLRVRVGCRTIINYMDSYSRERGYLVDPDGLSVAELSRLGLITSNCFFSRY